MTISSLNIKITVDDTKNDKEWVAKKKTNFLGDKTTIKFYQREKNQGNFQKLADFLTGVKPGREMVSKYIDELGLANTRLNPKNNAPETKGDELNRIFQHVSQKTDTRTAFEASELLVSHRDDRTQKEITITINGKEIQNATRNRKQLQQVETDFFLLAISKQDRKQSAIKLPIAAIELAVDIRENRPQSFNTNDVAKAHKELSNFKTASNGQPWLNAEVSGRLDRLISALGSKLETPKQTAQTEKSFQKEAVTLKKIERDVFLSDFEKLDVPTVELSSTYLALGEAFDIRDKFPNNFFIKPTYNQMQETCDTLTKFRDNYKTQAGFDAISEGFDQLITVLENKSL